MSSSSDSSYPCLPLEILSKIFDDFPVEDGDAVAITRAMQANRLFYQIIKDSVIWKVLYEDRYRHRDVGREQERERQMGENWRLRYKTRWQIDREAMGYLNKIVHASDMAGRIDALKKVVFLGNDIWDVLKYGNTLPAPIHFQCERDIELVKQGRPLSTLTKSYWSQELLGVMARHSALETWLAAFNGELGHALPLEECLSYLSSFYGVHPDDVLRELDSLAANCRSYLEAQGVVYDKQSSNFESEKVALAIYTFLRSQGFKIADTKEKFFRVQNSFPHLSLADYRDGTLPLSMVSCFVAIARRLGIPSTALNAPYRVLASMLTTVIDMLEGQIVPIDAEQQRECQRLQSDEGAITELSLVLLARSASNIMNACNHSTQTADPKLYQMGMYAAGCVHTFIRRSRDGIWAARVGMTDHPADRELFSARGFFQGHLAVFGQAVAEIEPLFRTDRIEDWKWSAPSRKFRRPKLDTSLFVGRIVNLQHPEGNGFGVVVGWTVDDEKNDEPAKVTLGVLIWKEDLYGSIVLACDETLSPTQVSRETLRAFYKDKPVLGYYFSDAEFFCDSVSDVNDEAGEGRARFVMNELYQKVYPDDDAVGAAWMRS